MPPIIPYCLGLPGTPAVALDCSINRFYPFVFISKFSRTHSRTQHLKSTQHLNWAERFDNTLYENFQASQCIQYCLPIHGMTTLIYLISVILHSLVSWRHALYIKSKYTPHLDLKVLMWWSSNYYSARTIRGRSAETNEGWLGRPRPNKKN